MTGIEIEGIEATARLLREGLSLAEIRRVLLPESWQRALRACAAADVVTADLFDSVLRPYAQPDPPELTNLVEQRLIEPVPGNRPGGACRPPTRPGGCVNGALTSPAPSPHRSSCSWNPSWPAGTKNAATTTSSCGT